MKWEKIFANHVANKGLTSKYLKYTIIYMCVGISNIYTDKNIQLWK